MGTAGWIVGAACAVTMAAVLASGLARDGGRLGPASWVTLARATLAVGVAALAADSLGRHVPAAPVVAIAAVALALDLVDGRVARRTGTATGFGARFDGEVDAFLILALSVYVAPSAGAWVLAIGLARYAFLAGEWLLPWMRAPLPPRRWRKAVAAAQGIVLTVAAAGVLPSTLTEALLAAALAALAVSVAECVWWLWRRRHLARVPERPPLPAGVAATLTLLAGLLVWAALVAPHQPDRLTPGAFARLPIELLAIIALAVLLPTAPRRALVAAAGVALSLIVVVKVLDIGFFTAFDRPFRPVDDAGYAGIGIETLGDAIGRTQAHLVAAAAVVAIVALLTVPVLALGRVARVAARHRAPALAAVAALCVVWAVLRVAGAPVASLSAATLAVDEVQAVQAGLRDRATFAREIERDRFRAVPGDRLLTGLRGKDVLLVFVESYGRVAVEGSPMAPRIDAVRARGESELRAAGFEARSAFLTSPTFGGLSWLAHATLQAGVRVDGQRRHDQLMGSERLSLTRAFARAGWRTVATVPQNKRDWPEARSFYDYDRVLDRRNLGYRGPDFGLPPMPDQYAMLELQRRELARRDRPPVFAEVDLTSSHTPWTRIPRLLPWEQVGDGSVFGRVPPALSTEASVFGDEARARAAYAASIEYVLRMLFSFAARYGTGDTVLIVAGDHQPSTKVSGYDAGRDVPVSVIARDPAVLERIGGWRWQPGMSPGPRAPVWPMRAFRDRFLSAFG